MHTKMSRSMLSQETLSK